MKSALFRALGVVGCAGATATVALGQGWSDGWCHPDDPLPPPPARERGAGDRDAAWAVRQVDADRFRHRRGLFDAILIKENHIAAAGGIAKAVEAARAARPDVLLEVECETRADVDEALEAGAPRLLLDNMTPHELREMVLHVDGRAELEASGGITITDLHEVAETGVDYISLGALTHSAPALDLSLLVAP